MIAIKNINKIIGDNLFKKISYIICFIFLNFLFSCSDELEWDKGILDYGQSNILTVEFIIPDSEHIVLTRSDDDSERKIDNLCLFFFDNEDNLKIRLELDEDNIDKINRTIKDDVRQCEVSIALEEDFNYSNYKVYAVANTILSSGDLLADFIVDNAKTLSQLLDKTTDTFYEVNSGRIMSGKMEKNIITLNRISAKLSLKQDLKNKDIRFELSDYENVSGSEITYGGFSIYYSEAECYVMAPEKNPSYHTGNRRIKDNPIKAEKLVNNNVIRYDAYALPTKTYEGNTIETYVVIKASYNDEECYYAIPLYDNKTDSFLNIEPNHWYEMTITDVLVKGAPSAEEAIKNHNFNQIMVEIHDHAAMVLSMVSDGIHELGVTRQVTLTQDQSSQQFIVKCYAADTDEFKEEDLKIEIKEGDDWFSIEEGEELVPSYDISDSDNFGTQIAYTVTVKNPDNLYTDQEGIILVSYRGLSREISVYYDSSFDASSVCSVVLTINNYETDRNGAIENNITINDYWEFIKGNGTGGNRSTYGEETPRLFGVQPDDLPDNRIRNEGFHFPMPYGNENLSDYAYTINFSKLESGEKKINNIKWELISNNKNDNFIPTYIKAEKSSSTEIRLTMDEAVKGSYKYSTGKIKFTITYTDGSPKSEINLGIYHTGFFHYATNPSGIKYYEDGEIGYYYYAVPTLNGKPWLDRNIGAKSSKRFGSRATGGNIGEPEAGGKYFTIAQHKEYDDPTFIEDMCPPGYHIPTSSEWNEIRLSNDFKTQNRNVNGELYMSTFFDSGDNQIGDIYFQKGRFYNKINSYDEDPKAVAAGSGKTGDDLSGYYWTRTVAPGMEKEQMGKWIRVLYFNGSSTSYINGSLINHKYYVRCKGGNIPEEQNDHYVSFRVHNATHVYIFDPKTNTGLYNFPGRAIGTATSSGQWQYFSSTTSIDLNKLLVVFNKIEKDGSITTYTKSGNSFTTSNSFSDDILNSEFAWDVESNNGKYFDFCSGAQEKGEKNIYDSEDEKDNKMNSHICSGETFDPGINGGTGGTSGEGTFKKGDEIYFYWPKTINGDYYDNILAWYSYAEHDNYMITGNDWGKGSENMDSEKFEYDGQYSGMHKYYHKIGDHDNYKGAFNNFNVQIFKGNNYIQIDINDNNGTPVVVDSNQTRGGEIRKEEKDGHNVWIIKLFDPNGTTSGGEDEKGEYTTGTDTTPSSSEEIIFSGHQTLKWSGITLNYDWSKLKDGDWIRVYGYPTDANADWWCISMRRSSSGWGDLITGATLENGLPEGPFHQIDNLNGYAELILTQRIIEDIRKNGLLVTGTGFVVTYVTVKKSE